jgi:hypothetical protein
MDRTTKTLRERVLEHVAVLRIPLTADELDAVLSTTEREHLSLLESLFLGLPGDLGPPARRDRRACRFDAFPRAR